MKNLLTLLKDRNVLWLPALNQPQCEIAAPQNANHFALLAALPPAPGRALAKRLCSLMFWRWLYSYVIAVTPWAAWPLTAILEYLLLACLWQGISSAVAVFAGMYGMEVVFKALPMAVIILMVLSCFIISLGVSTIACAALTLPVLNRAWLRNPQLITTSDEGLTLDWLRSGRKGPIRLEIIWSEIVSVHIADISYQGHNAMPVLEVRLASAVGKPWQFYSWAVRMSQLFSDPATGWCLEDRGTQCIRIPLALLGTEHERKSLIASISQQLTPDRLDASVTAQFQTNDFDSFTALWLADLHSAPSRYSKRTLPVGHLLKRAEYLIESIFGYGGFSVVYQAVRNHLAQNATQDTTLDERVAIKELMLVVCCTLPQATLALWILFIGTGGVALFALLGANLTARISHGAIVIGDLEKPYMSLSWQNLVSVRASVEQQFFLFPKREFLWLCFTDHNIPISLKKLKAQEKVKLFNMLSQTVPIEALSPEALYLQIQTLSGNSGATIRDFTEIWLDEFNRRFELSNHVPLAAGTLVGDRFTVLATLAVRMNQTVYLIKSKSGEHLVLKELVTAGDDDEALKAKTLEHFEREAAFLARLSHPQIVKIRDHFVDGDRQYMAMDYIDGPNLREYVRANGPFSATQTRKVAGQIAEILEYLHGQAPPVVHRDLTPNNLLYLSKAERIVLVDFGSANTFVTNGTATLVGRQSYMPPEQFKGKPEPASDIYAFAATLHFLLTGEDPKPLETKEIVGLADGQLNSLISACGLLDPTQRPSAAEIISILNGLSAPMPGISGAKQ